MKDYALQIIKTDPTWTTMTIKHPITLQQWQCVASRNLTITPNNTKKLGYHKLKQILCANKSSAKVEHHYNVCFPPNQSLICERKKHKFKQSLVKKE